MGMTGEPSRTLAKLSNGKEGMIVTNEQRELLTILVNNRKVLEELLQTVSIKQKQVKDLQMGESIFVAGITWSKFAEDDEGNAYMLADEKICDMDFGESNDWRESPVERKLNYDLFNKVVAELGTDSLLTIHTDLFSHDGLRDYGKCENMISLLTYDLYRNNRKNIKKSKNEFWMCTPDSTPSGYGSHYVRCVDVNGYIDYSECGHVKGVRPFFILKHDIFVSCSDQIT